MSPQNVHKKEAENSVGIHKSYIFDLQVPVDTYITADPNISTTFWWPGRFSSLVNAFVLQWCGVSAQEQFYFYLYKGKLATETSKLLPHA